MCHGASHGEAVGSVAVAYTGDEWSSECPDGVAESFFFMVSDIGKCLFFCELFHSEVVGSAEKTFVESMDDLSEPASVRCDAEAVAVAFIFSESGVAAKAGDADDGVYKFEDLFDIFDGYDLAEMVFLHMSGDEPSDESFYERWRLVKLFQFSDSVFDVVGSGEEVFDESASANVTEQVVGIVTRLQVPLFTFAMF